MFVTAKNPGLTGKHAQMTGFSRHVTGKFHVQSRRGPRRVGGGIYQSIDGEDNPINICGFVISSSETTFVCDGKRPGFDGKTRQNQGFFPSCDG